MTPTPGASPRRTKKKTTKKTAKKPVATAAKKTTPATKKTAKKTTRKTTKKPAQSKVIDTGVVVDKIAGKAGRKRAKDNEAFHEFFDETYKVRTTIVGFDGELKHVELEGTGFEIVLRRLLSMALHPHPDVAMPAIRAVLDRKVSKAPTVVSSTTQNINYMTELETSAARAWQDVEEKTNEK